ncbi:MAG: hypothetical protein ACRBF0_14720 [Calditrichia bacterium]
MMQLSGAQVSANYQQAYSYSEQLLSELLRGRGYSQIDAHEHEELCQSALGEPAIVELLTTIVFSEKSYRETLLEAINSVRRIFFPDIGKRRFTSVDKLEHVLHAEEKEILVEPDVDNSEQVLDHLLNVLSPEDGEYLSETILAAYPEWWRSLGRISFDEERSDSTLKRIVETISLLRRFYPDGQIPLTVDLDGRKSLTDQQLCDSFFKCYVGIERRMPPHLFAKNGDERAAVLVRFLIEDLLQSTPEAILEQADEVFFLKHKLQNLYRRFNYSANRVLRNAYVDRIHPWIASRCDANYWEVETHRTEAVRWLIEERLGFMPEKLYRHSLKREHFASNGLSYLFNTYYNSASRAVAVAYPQLRPWQIGKIPASVWTDETAAEAIRWMISEKSWDVSELADRIRAGELTRKTFSEFGLATLFEKRFGKNLFRAINAAWPRRYEPWEIGNVPASYWSEKQNVFYASSWIAEQEGFSAEEIVPAVRKKEFAWQRLQKYSIGNALKRFSGGRIERLFAPLFVRDMQLEQEKSKNLRKARQLATVGDRKGLFRGFIFFELFGARHTQNTKYRQLITRMNRRRHD